MASIVLPLPDNVHTGLDAGSAVLFAHVVAAATALNCCELFRAITSAARPAEKRQYDRRLAIHERPTL